MAGGKFGGNFNDYLKVYRVKKIYKHECLFSKKEKKNVIKSKYIINVCQVLNTL